MSNESRPWVLEHEHRDNPSYVRVWHLFDDHLKPARCGHPSIPGMPICLAEPVATISAARVCQECWNSGDSISANKTAKLQGSNPEIFDDSNPICGLCAQRLSVHVEHDHERMRGRRFCFKTGQQEFRSLNAPASLEPARDPLCWNCGRLRSRHIKSEDVLYPDTLWCDEKQEHSFREKPETVSAPPQQIPAYKSPNNGYPFSSEGYADLENQLQDAARSCDSALMEQAALAIRRLRNDLNPPAADEPPKKTKADIRIDVRSERNRGATTMAAVLSRMLQGLGMDVLFNSSDPRLAMEIVKRDVPAKCECQMDPAPELSEKRLVAIFDVAAPACGGLDLSSINRARKRISGYLRSGGLFNPELMNADRVRDLLLDLDNELAVVSAAIIQQQERQD